MRNNYGMAVKLIRTYKNMSISELAAKSSLSYSSIQKIEQNERKGSIESLSKIAEGLGIELKDILVEEVTFKL